MRGVREGRLACCECCRTRSVLEHGRRRAAPSWAVWRASATASRLKPHPTTSATSSENSTAQHRQGFRRAAPSTQRRTITASETQTAARAPRRHHRRDEIHAGNPCPANPSIHRRDRRSRTRPRRLGRRDRPDTGRDVRCRHRHAGQLLVTVGDNPDRIASSAAFAHLCGAAPIPATSGRTRTGTASTKAATDTPTRRSTGSR